MGSKQNHQNSRVDSIGGKEEEPALIVASEMNTNTPYPSPNDSPTSKYIIHQTFSLARDWSKRITWTNIPQLETGEYPRLLKAG